jgi:hypothetical protein
VVGSSKLNNESSGSINLYSFIIAYNISEMNTRYLNVYQSGLIYPTILLGVGKIPMTAKVSLLKM